MRNRKFKRELRKAAKLDLNELHKAARRNKRLLKNALHCKFRRAYAARKALCKEYGRLIALRMRQV